LQASSLARSESAEVNKFLVDQQPDEDSGWIYIKISEMCFIGYFIYCVGNFKHNWTIQIFTNIEFHTELIKRTVN
jgi:hypothetical protein